MNMRVSFPDCTALSAKQLEQVFEQCFVLSHNTRLVGGASEPLYRPLSQSAEEAHIIFYSHDYAASALHEVAHWCVAGKERRQLEDYGYWYAPDGRTAEQQALFERVEVRPQAMEWLFNVAAGRRFRVSADNLTMGLGPSDTFKQAVFDQARAFCIEGLPSRAERFAFALAQLSGVKDVYCSEHYQRHFL